MIQAPGPRVRVRVRVRVCKVCWAQLHACVRHNAGDKAVHCGVGIAGVPTVERRIWFSKVVAVGRTVSKLDCPIPAMYPQTTRQGSN